MSGAPIITRPRPAFRCKSNVIMSVWVEYIVFISCTCVVKDSTKVCRTCRLICVLLRIVIVLWFNTLDNNPGIVRETIQVNEIKDVLIWTSFSRRWRENDRIVIRVDTCLRWPVNLFRVNPALAFHLSECDGYNMLFKYSVIYSRVTI